MNSRVLVIGATGRLGAAIVKMFSDRDVIATTRASLDLADPIAIAAAVKCHRPAVVVNCGAFNYVDEAEDRPLDALTVNAFAVRTLARAAEDVGTTLVHFGSDFVFDGDAQEPYEEEATPSPQNVYALSKLLGDWFALDAPRSFVLRVESLFGAPSGWSGRRGSLDGIVEGLERGEIVKVFTDRVVSPSYVDDVARATKHLLESGAAPGLYHCVNSGCATWYEIAREAAHLLGVPARLESITLASASLRAPRPRYCALANVKLASAGFVMPPWQDALRRWLEARKSSRSQCTMDGIHG